MNGWEVAALVAGSLFTTGVVYVASVRLPRWAAMDVPSFLPDFERAINVADKVQPMLLAATIVSAAVFSSSLEGTTRVLAYAAIAGFVITMVASLTVLVPLQRRMIRLGDDPSVPQREMRSRWVKGHLGRTSLALLSFVLLLLAVVGVG